MIPPLDPAVADVFASYPPEVRSKMMALRRLILETAAATVGVGPLMETLKWGEPAYLTSASKSGSTIRIGWKRSSPRRYGIYFNCRTDLVESFRALFPETFRFEGNRAIVFHVADVIPDVPLRACIAVALTYHRTKRSRKQTRTRRGLGCTSET